MTSEWVDTALYNNNRIEQVDCHISVKQLGKVSKTDWREILALRDEYSA